MENYYDKIKFSLKSYSDNKKTGNIKEEVVLDYGYTWHDVVDAFQKFLVNGCGYTYLNDVDFSKVIQKARDKVKAKKKEKNGI